MAGWKKIREHIWQNEHGTPVLKHTKMTKAAGGVVFPWRHRVDFGNGIERWFGGIGADAGIVHPLLYRRDVFAQADRTSHVFICEGEADTDAASAEGLLAVTAGHAGSFGSEQALLFRGWRGRITIVRDRDLPGAYGAAKAYDALRAVRIPATRLRVARGRCKAEGSDLRDHLAAGYTPGQLLSEPIASLRRLAAEATPEVFARSGYSGINSETGFTWVSADEAGQLRGWTPGRAS